MVKYFPVYSMQLDHKILTIGYIYKGSNYMQKICTNYYAVNIGIFLFDLNGSSNEIIYDECTYSHITNHKLNLNKRMRDYCNLVVVIKRISS